MLAITKPSPNGTTAQAISAVRKVIIGAMRNSMPLALDGTIVSFSISLRPSAKGCSRPNGPTTLGPRRSWIDAQTLRST